MQQSGVKAGDSRFLAAVLRRGRGKNAAHFSDEAALRLQLLVWSRKLRICAAMFPKRVGVPKMMP